MKIINNTEYSEQELEQALANGLITKQVVYVDTKRPYKSIETIYNELLESGVEVAIHNGIYCKVVGGTFEAINEQTEIDDYVLYEVKYDSQD